MTKQKFFTNPIQFIVVFLVIIAALFFGNKYYQTDKLNKFKKNVLPKALKKAINNEKTQFTIGDIKEVSGVYEFALTVNGQKYTSYISKDGKFLFPSVVLIDVTPTPTNNQTSDTSKKKLSCNDLKKTDAPNLTAFVVSQCPYGLQMQRVFKVAISEQPELDKSLTVRYIGTVENNKVTSMHGDEEATENLRQICIREEQKNLYWPYVSCYMQAGKSEECLTTAGLDTTLLTTCMTDKNKGLKYAQEDFTLANKFNVSGSPTLVSNNSQIVSEFDFGGRVANSLQEIICCGSKTKSSICQNKISTEEVASSFSTTDISNTEGSNTNANCN